MGGVGEQGLEVVLLQRISDDLATVQKDMADVRERMVRIESQGALERIARAETETRALMVRVAALEADRERRTGMTDLTSWVIKSAPWIAAMVVGAIAYVLKGHVL